MQESSKNSVLDFLFFYYNRRLLKKHFYQLLYREAAPVPSGPVLFYANHSNWWDGLVLHYINHAHFKKDAFAMIDEEGLRQFPFFRKLGAFSIDRSGGRKMLQSLQYAKDQLHSNNSVWIFPQGQEEHLEKRPLRFSSGISRIVSGRENVPVIPVSLYYSYFHKQTPYLFIETGQPIYLTNSTDGSSYSSITTYLETQLTEQLDQLAEDIIEEKRMDSFEILLKGKATVSESFQKIFRRSDQ